MSTGRSTQRIRLWPAKQDQSRHPVHGGCLRIENADMSVAGMAKKRLGRSEVSCSPSSTRIGIAGSNTRVAWGDGDYVSDGGTSIQGGDASLTGAMPCNVVVRQLRTPQAPSHKVSSCANGGYVYTAAVCDAGIYVTAHSILTGACTLGPTLASSTADTFAVRMVSTSSGAMLVYCESSVLTYRMVSPAALGGASTLDVTAPLANVSNGFVIDACEVGGVLGVVYVAASPLEPHIILCDPASPSSTSAAYSVASPAHSGTVLSVACCNWSNTHIAVLWHEYVSTSRYVTVSLVDVTDGSVDDSNEIVGGTPNFPLDGFDDEYSVTSLRAIYDAPYADSLMVLVGIDYQATGANGGWVRARATSAYSLAGTIGALSSGIVAGVECNGVPLSHPVETAAGRVVFPAADGGPDDLQERVCWIADGIDTIAQSTPGLSASAPWGSPPMHTDSIAGMAATFSVVYPARTDSSSVATTYHTALGINITPERLQVAQSVDGGFRHAGGSPRRVDALGVQKTAMDWSPGNIVAASLTSGGGLAVGSTYQYAAVYESVTSGGDIIRSAPTVQFFQLTPASSSETRPTLICRPPPPMGDGSGAPSVAWYRTQAGESTLYRIGAGSHQYQDTSSDPVDDGAVLYVQGGEVEPVPPPPCVATCEWSGREALVSSIDGDLWYTKPRAPGIAPEYSDSLVVPLGTSEQAIALAELGDKILIFGRNSIRAVRGSGYNALAQGQNLSSPWYVHEGIGCDSCRTVAQIPGGVAFLHRGIPYAVSGDGAVQRIGGPGEIDLSMREVIATVRMRESSSVGFVCSDQAVVVVNYDTSQWSTWLSAGKTALDAAGVDSMYILDGGGRICGPSLSSYLDGSTAYDLSVDTGWVDVGARGRMREILVHAEKSSDHSLVCEIAYDYEPEWYTALSYSASALEPFSRDDHAGDMSPSPTVIGSAEVVRFVGQRQKCSAFRVRVSDGGSSSNPCAILRIDAMVDAMTAGANTRKAGS